MRLFRDTPIVLALVVGAMGSMANTLAHGLVDNSVFVNDLSLVFVLLLGIVGTLRSSAASAPESI
jgi:hypothetical protein